MSLTYLGEAVTYAGQELVATIPEVKAYLTQYSGIQARIDALSVADQNSFMGMGRSRVTEIQAAAQALYAANRARHDALIDVAWALKRLP